MEKEQLKIEYVSLDEIKPNEYNPKKMTEKEEEDLEKSITEFGIVDPLIVNNAKGRKGIIIGGHQRYKIYKKLNYKKVPVVWINVPDLKKEKELCLRLSKNTGSWDWDLLAKLNDENLLLNVGFEEVEIDKYPFKIENEELEVGKYNFGTINSWVRIGDFYCEIEDKKYKQIKKRIEEAGSLENFLDKTYEQLD